MQLYFILAAYIGVAAVGVMVFLWGRPDGNSFFDKLYRLFCMQLPAGLKWLLGKVAGPRGPQALDAIWEYLCYTSNPLTQIFYLCVIIGGYLTFVLYGYPHVPNRYADAYHKDVGLGLFCLCLSVWWRACTSDPGMVTKDNVDFLIEHYPWDEQIFTSQECRTCKVLKPARSKHCPLCGICVSKFDHHCIWINNCVGVGNHHWFLGFLALHAWLCSYGAVLGSIILWNRVQEQQLFEAVFVDRTTGERHTASYTIVLQYILATEGMVMLISALCAIMGAVLMGFLGWHLNLVRTGTTTNEFSKWRILRRCLKEEGAADALGDLKNIYNHGCLGNFREVLWPIDVHASCSGEPKETEASDDRGCQGAGESKKGTKTKAKKIN